MAQPLRFELKTSAFGGQHSAIMVGRQHSKFNMLLSQCVARSRSSSLVSVPELCHGTVMGIKRRQVQRRYETLWWATIATATMQK